MVWPHVHFDDDDVRWQEKEACYGANPVAIAGGCIALHHLMRLARYFFLLGASRLSEHLSRCTRTLRLVKRRRRCSVSPGRYEDIEITCALRAPQTCVLYCTVPTKLGRFVAVLTTGH